MSWPTTKKCGATADLNAIDASLRNEAAATSVGSRRGSGRATKRNGARVPRTTGETGRVVKAATVERVGRWPAPAGRVRGRATETVESVLSAGTVPIAVTASNVRLAPIAGSVRNAATAVNVETARTAARVISATGASVRPGRAEIVASVRRGVKVSSGSEGTVTSLGTTSAVSGRPEDAGNSSSNPASALKVDDPLSRVVGLRRGTSGTEIASPSARVQADVG